MLERESDHLSAVVSGDLMLNMARCFTDGCVLRFLSASVFICFVDASDNRFSFFVSYNLRI